MTRPRLPASPRVRVLEDALRDLATVHGLEALLNEKVPIATRAVIQGAVRSSARRADAITRVEAR